MSGLEIPSERDLSPESMERQKARFLSGIDADLRGRPVRSRQLLKGRLQQLVVPRSQRGVLWRAATVAAVSVAILIGVLVGPERNVSPDVASAALTAIDKGSVIHFTAENGTPPHLVSLQTGRAETVHREVEVWYDSSLGTIHLKFRDNGRLVGEQLGTEQQWWTSGRPRGLPSSAAPSLGPQLAGFLDQYRTALASGSARVVGQTEFANTPAYVLEFSPSSTGNRLNEPETRVIVDADTYKPLAVEQSQNGNVARSTIRTIETLDRASADFTRPKVVEAQAGYTRLASVSKLSQATAAGEFPSALWAGQSAVGLQLTSVALQNLAVSEQDGEQRVDKGLILVYGDAHGPDPTQAGAVAASFASGNYAAILQSARPESFYGWTDVAAFPADGYARELKEGSRIWLLRKNNVYVTIIAPSQNTMLEIARSLEPI